MILMKNKSITELVNLENHMKLFIKARPYPEGTVRSWSGKKYVKKGGHWDPIGDDTSRKNTSDSKKQSNPARRSGDKKQKEARVVKGSKEMLTELKRIESGKRIFIDDLSGARKKTFNLMTKDGLVKWVSAGGGEYKAILTQAGTKALDGAHAVQAKSKRKGIKK